MSRPTSLLFKCVLGHVCTRIALTSPLLSCSSCVFSGWSFLLRGLRLVFGPQPPPSLSLLTAPKLCPSISSPSLLFTLTLHHSPTLLFNHIGARSVELSTPPPLQTTPSLFQLFGATRAAWCFCLGVNALGLKIWLLKACYCLDANPTGQGLAPLHAGHIPLQQPEPCSLLLET